MKSFLTVLFSSMVCFQHVKCSVPAECTSVSDNPLYLDWISGTKGDMLNQQECFDSCNSDPACRLANYVSHESKCKKYGLKDSDIDLVRCNDEGCEVIPTDETLDTNTASAFVLWDTESMETMSARCRQECESQRRCNAFRIKMRTQNTKCYLVHIKENGIYQCPKGVVSMP